MFASPSACHQPLPGTRCNCTSCIAIVVLGITTRWGPMTARSRYLFAFATPALANNRFRQENSRFVLPAMGHANVGRFMLQTLVNRTRGFEVENFKQDVRLGGSSRPAAPGRSRPVTARPAQPLAYPLLQRRLVAPVPKDPDGLAVLATAASNQRGWSQG